MGSVSGRVPVMVLDYASSKTDPSMFRQDPWAHESWRTLTAPGDFFRELGNPSALSPHELAEIGAFEVSNQHRVAIWHAGFTSATHALGRIGPWLSGDADHVLKAPRAS